MTSYGICTIFAKNYLSAVRVLTESFLEHHSDGKVYGLLCDRLDGFFEPNNERFVFVALEDLNIPSLPQMLYRYDVVELSTAVKAAFLKHLFEREGLEKLCYFDPDIQILSPLDEIFQLLDQHNVVLLPHLTEPQSMEWVPSERQLLQVGVYNLGFIGLKRGSVTERFLDWWHGKLEKECYVDPSQGLFVDQHWIDLVPAIFDGVYIHRDPGYNVAYWNLPERSIVKKEGQFFCLGRPLRFFHFSGYSPRQPRCISKHVPESKRRYSVDDFGDVAELFYAYGELLMKHGFETTVQWPYAFGYFSNGVPVPQVARRFWKEVQGAGFEWSDPLNTESTGSFYEWMLTPIDRDLPVIHRMAEQIYRLRPDVQRAFPHWRDRQRRDFVRWFVETASREYDLAEPLVSPMKQSLYQTAPSPEKWAAVIRPWLARLQSYPLCQRIASSRVAQRVRQILFPSGASIQQVTRPKIQHGERRESQGLNVIGYLSAETGVGEIPRAIIRALSTCNYPVSIIHLDNPDGARREDRSVLHIQEGAPHTVNLFAVNADGWNAIRPILKPEMLHGRVNIGMWFWEISHFPERLLSAFEGLDEIWSASSFVQETLSAVSPIPVVKMGAPIVLREHSSLTREDLGLPKDKLIFLYAFDMLSIPERKNPLAVVEAYRIAFEPHFADTHLVLKANHLHRFPDWRERLQEAVASVGGTLIEETLDRPHVNALFQQADVYVSLHRSEGFGLTIAESMRMGKAVIATDYSGPHDYLTQSNSYPVRYRLVELEKDYGPYPAGSVWAEPDVEHAAELMRRALGEPAERACKGAQAAQDIEMLYGASSVCKRIISRIERLTKS